MVISPTQSDASVMLALVAHLCVYSRSGRIKNVCALELNPIKNDKKKPEETDANRPLKLLLKKGEFRLHSAFTWTCAILIFQYQLLCYQSGSNFLLDKPFETVEI